MGGSFDRKKISTKVIGKFKGIVRSKVALLFLLVPSILILISISTLHALEKRGIVMGRYISRVYDGLEYEFQSDYQILRSGDFITDVRIKKCLLGFNCGMPSEDYFWEMKPIKLNLFPEKFMFFNYYMFVERRVPGDFERIVIDIMFTSTDDQPSTKVKGSKFIKHQISSTGYMWLNYLDSMDPSVPILRGIEVLYGDDDFYDPRKNWNLHSLAIPIPGKYSMEPKISTLSVSVLDAKEILNSEQKFKVWKQKDILITNSSKFKIMQLSDMHIGNDAGVCYEDCRFDTDTLKLVDSAIQKEGDVQLIVITGDMIDAERTVHYPSAILKALAPVLESEIPFVFTFGDTDFDSNNEFGYSEIVFQFISTLSGCYNKGIYQDNRYRYPGLTDGNVKIYNLPDGSGIDARSLGSKHADALVTYLDTHKHVIADSQTTYMYRTNHDSGMETEFKLLFTHHPLPFYENSELKMIGQNYTTGRWWVDADQNLLHDIKASGYKAVGFGHVHESDACYLDQENDPKILLCYSGVTGECGRTENDPYFKRRLRIFEFDFEKKNIFTWERDNQKSFDFLKVWAA